MPVLPFILSIAFTALLAQLTIHLPDAAGGIPVTGQSLAVLLVGMLLHRPWGALAVMAYVLIGALGLPIFADGRGGWEVLAGGSGGFLLGFIAGAATLGWLAEKGWGRSLGKALAAMAIGTAIILLCGLLRLALLYGWDKALDYGFFPFWPGALAKIVVGGIIVRLFSKPARRGQAQMVKW